MKIYNDEGEKSKESRVEEQNLSSNELYFLYLIV